jgi:class 3 adenylate cyclase
VPAEERKLATVLFADLVGSTALADSQDPERTRLLLDRFYDAMATEIERAGGTVEKFAGDAVMAAFGAPAALEDHAERALHAALAMQRRLRELFGDRVALRIGVNTGEVMVGRAREGSSFVTGDIVNVAARFMAQIAAPPKSSWPPHDSRRRRRRDRSSSGNGLPPPSRAPSNSMSRTRLRPRGSRTVSFVDGSCVLSP